MAFFGELYLRSTLPFLSNEVTEQEIAYLARALDEHPLPGAVVDLGCGHGRHAGPLRRSLKRDRLVFGVELDPVSLQERASGFEAIRADFFRLPLADASLAAAFAWYSSFFVFDDELQLPLFREAARCLKPGGLLVLHTVPYERVAAAPYASYDGVLPDGSHLVERASFDPASGRDLAHRDLHLPDGRVLSADFFIRYYPLPALTKLLSEAGLAVRWVHGGLDGAPLNEASTELIVGAERAYG